MRGDRLVLVLLVCKESKVYHYPYTFRVLASLPQTLSKIEVLQIWQSQIEDGMPE